MSFMQRDKLYDNHGREINYLRLAVTDRCNLRCFYCMPEEGIKYVPRTDLLTYEEMLRLLGVVAEMGINKIRITGGEPFVRKGMIEFMEAIARIEGINSIHLTTNGTLTEKLIPRLKGLGLKSVNLSLDTLDKQRFADITRRDEFDTVMRTFYALKSVWQLKRSLNDESREYWQAGKSVAGIQSIESAGAIVASFRDALA